MRLFKASLLTALCGLLGIAQAANPTTDGLLFNIDGVTKYYAGSNAYWLAFLTNDDDVDKVLDDFAADGLKILRIWGFNDVTETPSSGTVWFQSFINGSDPVINTGADGLQRLDYVVQAAESRGIKLIINFVNNWTDYGGMAAYMEYYGIYNSTTNEPWYLSTDAQDQYRKYIQTVVARYSGSDAVFAWELANEPRCHACDTSVIFNWASDTSSYIKSLDSSHMVTLGDEGFGIAGGDGSYPYTYGEGVDWVENLGISTLDFGTFHLYPASCEYFPTCFLHLANATTRGRTQLFWRHLDTGARRGVRKRFQAVPARGVWCHI